MEQHFVYVLRSIEHPEKVYVGYTMDLNQRFEDHNNGSQIYSRRYAPWEMVSYTVFFDRDTAANYESYLKSQSGRAFLRKRLVPVS